MADPVSAVAQTLKADLTVLALTSGRVYGAELPQSEAASQPRYAVVVKPGGGPGNSNYSPFYEQRVDVSCYGASAAAAMELSHACHKVLQNLTRTVVGTTILYRAVLSSGHSYYRDPGVPTWPIVLSTWLIATDINEVT